MTDKYEAADGVVKFELRFTQAPAADLGLLRALNEWRSIFHKLGYIGRESARYGGVAFGNVSQRLADDPDRFIITGTQTGGLPELTASHYVTVDSCEIERNRVTAHGPIEPSSEAMTHAMLYRLSDSIRFVFHVHAPPIWRKARALGFPVTDAEVAYGTPAMAAEMERLFIKKDLAHHGLVAMGGHEDGVVSIGSTADAAGVALLRAHIAASAAD